MRRLLALPALPLLLSGCLFDSPPETVRLDGTTMGTTYSVVAVAPPDGIDATALGDQVEMALADVNAKMSNWDPDSEISRFNGGTSTDPVPVSPDLETVLGAADAVHAISGGRFDVTVAPLIELWGFGTRTPETPVPADSAIAAARAAVGQGALLELADGMLRKARPDVTVNLSAIAKGYGADRVGAALQAAGVESYLVEIGGDVVAAGLNPDGAPWRIGIERPDAPGGTVEDIVGLSDRGMATSGDYRNYFERDGVRYSHIIDPVTGRPVTHRTASVTVIAGSGMEADALATALLVVDDAEALRIAADLDLPVLLILREAGGFVTVRSDAFARLAQGPGD